MKAGHRRPRKKRRRLLTKREWAAIGGGVVIGLACQGPTVYHRRHAHTFDFVFPDVTFVPAMLAGAACLAAFLLWVLARIRGRRDHAWLACMLAVFLAFLFSWPPAIQIGSWLKSRDLEAAVLWCEQLVPLIEAEHQRTGAFPVDLARLEERLPPRPTRLQRYLFYRAAPEGYELKIGLLTAGAILPDFLVWNRRDRKWYLY